MLKWRKVFEAVLCIGLISTSCVLAAQPAITTYGERNGQAPRQLDLFSFLVGTWKSIGETKLPNGTAAGLEVTWIGRYVLNGTAIADEFQSLTPDGKPYLGISLRSFDVRHGCWIIEYLNVSNSFIRRQVNPASGSVRRDGNTIIVISEDAQTRIRELYRVPDQNHFTYSIEISRDRGRNWDSVSLVVSMERVE